MTWLIKRRQNQRHWVTLKVSSDVWNLSNSHTSKVQNTVYINWEIFTQESESTCHYNINVISTLLDFSRSHAVKYTLKLERVQCKIMSDTVTMKHDCLLMLHRKSCGLSNVTSLTDPQWPDGYFNCFKDLKISYFGKQKQVSARKCPYESESGCGI